MRIWVEDKGVRGLGIGTRPRGGGIAWECPGRTVLGSDTGFHHQHVGAAAEGEDEDKGPDFEVAFFGSGGSGGAEGGEEEGRLE